jgi:hypothetical protein
MVSASAVLMMRHQFVSTANSLSSWPITVFLPAARWTHCTSTTQDRSRSWDVVLAANASQWDGQESAWVSTAGTTPRGFTYALPEGDPTISTTEGLTAVQLRSDAHMFRFNIDGGPTQQPRAAYELWVYLNSEDNYRGWILGSENDGCDRYVILHDSRDAGVTHVMPSCIKGATAATDWGTDRAPTKEWLHIVTLYDQLAGTESIYVNGRQGIVYSGVTHSDGIANEFRLGAPPYGAGHYANVDVAFLRLYSTWPSDTIVQSSYRQFLDKTGKTAI